MINLALGTTSKQKIGYVKEIICEIELDLIITPIDVSSEVSEQPTTEEETKKGSINRAKNAIKEIKKADWGLGIE